MMLWRKKMKKVAKLGFHGMMKMKTVKKIQSNPEHFFIRVSDNYRKVATVLLDFIGMKDFLCSDDTCSNLDGTLLFLIHILTMKIFTYSVMYYKERYSQRVNSRIANFITSTYFSIYALVARAVSAILSTLRSTTSYCQVKYKKTRHFLANEFLEPELEQ